MKDQEIKELLARYRSGNATEKDKAFLENWYQQYNQDWFELSDNERLQDTDLIWSALKQYTRQKQTQLLWPRIAVAASILFIFCLGAYFLTYRSDSTENIAKANLQDLRPGSNKATITLANGQQIALAGVRNGLLANQGNTHINIKNNDIVYEAAGSAEQLQYNTLTTPRGGQYPLTLSDGTRIWLDAASSITYPVRFMGNERRVKITGQVYFEVAHNPSKPFRVTANSQTVEVLGTHFNINAYDDEPGIKTTLFEGSVKVIVNKNEATLKPGQQAKVDQNKITVADAANIDEAIAWHKGLFEFHQTDIPTVMRQLSRWYDVDISYEGNIPDLTFSGKIYRNVTALKVSDILSYEKIHFRIEGKKIIVMP